MAQIKNILVPIDFSDVANNAFEYAIHVARKTDAKLIAYHVYHVPTISKLPPYEVESRQEEAEKEARQEYNQLCKELNVEGVDTEFVASLGLATDEIQDVITKRPIDLVIMGTHGASGVGSKLLGSITADVMVSAKAPVLAIPAEAKFDDIQRIAFATDYSVIDDHKELDTLIAFAKAFSANIHIVKVGEEAYVPEVEEAKAVIKFDHYFEEVKHSYHLATNEDVEEGLQEYIEDNNVDVLAMMPQHHNLYERLFKGSVTKRMVFHTKIPVLGFHGQT